MAVALSIDIESDDCNRIAQGDNGENDGASGVLGTEDGAGVVGKRK